MSRYVVSVAGEPVDVPAHRENLSVEPVEPGVYSVLLEGRSYEVRLDASTGRAWIAGHTLAVDVQDPREMTEGSASGSAAGRRDMIAPMPGKVIRLLAAEGDEVAAGQGIIVVEAMKMQNEMASPKTGRLAAVRVTAGDAVAAGQVLATVE